MDRRRVRVLGIGKYLPKRKVSAGELEHRLALPQGSIQDGSGVQTRYFIEDETAAYMGAQAAREAVKDAGLEFSDIDCIVGASMSPDQPIPCNAVLVQEELGLLMSGIPCFDMNATCLSFLMALDTVSYLIEAGRYRNVLIVTSETSSVGVNPADHETATLFGDGAAAVVVRKSFDHESSSILASKMETYSQGAHLTEMPGGGSRLPPFDFSDATRERFYFRMDGKKAYKLSVKVLPALLEKVLTSAGVTYDDLVAVIFHQTSLPMLKLLRRTLDIPEEKFVINIQDYGNTIACTIPFALHDCLRNDRIRRGDRVLLVGLSSGISVMPMVLEY